MFFEDFEVDKKYTLPDVSLTREEILAFAKENDPRSFHMTYDEKNPHYHFKDVIASGFQTIIVCWREWVKMGIDDESLVAGLGVDRVQWFNPVYPDDCLSATLTITKKRLFSSGKAGSVTFLMEVTNQREEQVLAMETTAMYQCRHPKK